MDKAEAAQWLTAAAVQGDVDSQLQLAQRYDIGEGVEQSRQLSLEWYKAAADQGKFRMERAFYHFGKIEEEDGNIAEALTYYTLAAQCCEEDASVLRFALLARNNLAVHTLLVGGCPPVFQYGYLDPAIVKMMVNSLDPEGRQSNETDTIFIV